MRRSSAKLSPIEVLGELGPCFLDWFCGQVFFNTPVFFFRYRLNHSEKSPTSVFFRFHATHIASFKTCKNQNNAVNIKATKPWYQKGSLPSSDWQFREASPVVPWSGRCAFRTCATSSRSGLILLRLKLLLIIHMLEFTLVRFWVVPLINSYV